MNEKELKEMYNELKRNEKIISNIDADFFFKFADVALNLLENKDREIEYWKNGFERELESNRENIIEIINKDNTIYKMAELIFNHRNDFGWWEVGVDIDNIEQQIEYFKNNVEENK